MRCLSYEVLQGTPFERLIMVKDRRTRRVRRLNSVRSWMSPADSINTFEIDATISFEGGCTLCISAEDTLLLSPGTWEFDVMGEYRGTEEKIAKGVIEVLPLTTITPLDNTALPNTGDSVTEGTVPGSFVFSQVDASAVWVINHNLGFPPNLITFDANGNEIEGVVTTLNSVQAIIEFNSARTGTATLS